MKTLYSIDLKENRISFLDSRFYMSENGLYQPSVTTILDAYPKPFGFMEWLKKNGEDSDTIRDEAGRRGSIVHGLTERFDMGEEVSLINGDGVLELRTDHWSMFERYVEFRRQYTEVSPVDLIEFSAASDKLKYGGTIDRLIQIGGKWILMDIKTSNYTSKHFWLQLAAYKQLVEDQIPDIRIDGIAILWLNAKTKGEGRKGAVQGQGWQYIPCLDATQMSHYLRLFKYTHELWLEENEALKPREISYSLKHKL